MISAFSKNLGISAIAVHEPDCSLPNAWFGPVISRKFEHHTGIPFLHWNAGLFRSSLRATSLNHWADPGNMDFLSRKILLDEWPTAERAEVYYTGLRLGPFSSNLALVVRHTLA